MTDPAASGRRARPLTRSARAACWFFGISFGGGGSYAVFTTENQAGTAALLILSTLFLIIAMTGHLPQRLQFGESSVEWPQEIVDAVATAIEEGPPEVAESVVSAISDSTPDRILSIASSRLSGATAERLAEAALKLASIQLEQETGETFDVRSNLRDGTVDLEVSRHGQGFADNDVVPVVVTLSNRAEFARKLVDYTSKSYLGRMMVVHYNELTSDMRAIFKSNPKVYTVNIGGSQSFEKAAENVKNCLIKAFEIDLNKPSP